MKKTIWCFLILATLLTSCSPAVIIPTPTQIAFTETVTPLTETPFPSPTSTSVPIGITEIASLGKGWASFIKWSPNRDSYAVGGSLGVHLYDAKSYKGIKYIPRELVSDVEFTPDGQLKGITSFYYVTIIRLSDEKVLFEKEVSAPSEMIFSPRDSLLAYIQFCLSIECPIRVVVSDYSTQKDLFTLDAGRESEEPRLNQIAFNLDGTLLAAAGSNGSIYIWEMSTGELKEILKGHKDSVRGVQFSPANKSILASYSDDGTVRLWNVETKKNIKTFSSFQGEIKNIVYASDGFNLEIFTDTAARAFDIATGRLVSKKEYTDADALLLQELPSSEGYIGEIAGLAYSPDGQTLAVSNDKSSPILLWDISTKQIKARIEIAAIKLVYSHNGKLLASVDENGEISIWDTGDYARLDTIRTKKVDSLAFSSDDSKVAVSSQWKINIWDISQNRIIQAINTGIEETILLSYSSNGNTISAVDPNGFSVNSWDVSTGKLIHTFTPPDDPNYREAINLSNNILAIFKETAAQNNTVQLWDANKGEQLQTLAVLMILCGLA